jgi:CRISPR-associated protein Cmr4
MGEKIMKNYLTYLYLLTPLHTGGSSQEGNLMGIAREVHTEFPYLPSSSLRGKIRSQLEFINSDEASVLFGQKIKDGQQPTEGEVWFADATLLFFPIASLSHHLIWITCPLWLERWNRWIKNQEIKILIQTARQALSNNKSALISFEAKELYLQTACLKEAHLQKAQIPVNSELIQPLIKREGLVSQILSRLAIISDEDCIALVETGLQREVRVALEENSKTVKGGSFRSEEAIPPEAVLFFPWGIKANPSNQTSNSRSELIKVLGDRLQFGGLEGLGRGWTDITTVEINKEKK